MTSVQYFDHRFISVGASKRMAQRWGADVLYRGKGIQPIASGSAAIDLSNDLWSLVTQIQSQAGGTLDYA